MSVADGLLTEASLLGRLADRWDSLGRRVTPQLAFVAVAALYVILAVGFLPILMLEQNRDWWTFDVAAANLAAGRPIYPGSPLNLYPPAMAMLWRLPLDGTVWLAISLACLPLVGLLAKQGERVAVVALVLLLPPLHYDLYTGNVTALYIATIALALGRPGWAGALPLGVVFAIAPKPALVPLVVFLLIRRPATVAGLAISAAAVTGVAVLVAGLALHFDYVRLLLDTPRELSGWTTGNLGLARLGSAAVIAGLVIGTVAVLAAARWATFERAAAVAIAAGALVQPTLGFYYAALLAVPIVLLWRVDRAAGLAAAVTVPLTAVISPVVGALFVIVLALVSELTARALPARPSEATP